MFLYYMEIYTFKSLLNTCSPPTCITKKYENPYLLYSRFKGGDDIFDTKTLTFAITVSTEFFTLSDKLVVPNSRERVDFKQQILALLLSHHSQLVSHKICLHFAIS